MGTNIAVKSKISPKDFRINFLFFIWFKENFSVQEVLKKIIKTNNGINSADGSFVLTAIAKTIALKIKYLSLIEFFSLREYKSKKILDIIKNQYPEIIVTDIDIFSSYDQALKYGVKGAPTLVFLEDDRAIKTHYGFQKEEQVKNWMKLFGWFEEL